eukprot:TRINITY_DN770_c0_g1_i2.p1 TRINITY_DN770_c0_g1~~TRINITY_DN770_c0_g1_i2.p1  ORF type:complete len:378 (+),score=134.77 TRINITY_DN770_c0_g1_i2:63-1196(+)
MFTNDEAVQREQDRLARTLSKQRGPAAKPAAKTWEVKMSSTRPVGADVVNSSSPIVSAADPETPAPAAAPLSPPAYRSATAPYSSGPAPYSATPRGGETSSSVEHNPNEGLAILDTDRQRQLQAEEERLNRWLNKDKKRSENPAILRTRAPSFSPPVSTPAPVPVAAAPSFAPPVFPPVAPSPVATPTAAEIPNYTPNYYNNSYTPPSFDSNPPYTPAEEPAYVEPVSEPAYTPPTPQETSSFDQHNNDTIAAPAAVVVEEQPTTTPANAGVSALGEEARASFSTNVTSAARLLRRADLNEDDLTTTLSKVAISARTFSGFVQDHEALEDIVNFAKSFVQSTISLKNALDEEGVDIGPHKAQVLQALGLLYLTVAAV